MAKSNRNERRYADDYEYETVQDRRSKKAQRRQDKRAINGQLPCEKLEDQ